MATKFTVYDSVNKSYLVHGEHFYGVGDTSGHALAAWWGAVMVHNLFPLFGACATYRVGNWPAQEDK